MRRKTEGNELEWQIHVTGAQQLYIRVSDVQRVFGISESTIRRQAKTGALTIHKRGVTSLLKIAEVSAWIEGEKE